MQMNVARRPDIHRDFASLNKGRCSEVPGQAMKNRCWAKYSIPCNQFCRSVVLGTVNDFENKFFKAVTWFKNR